MAELWQRFSAANRRLCDTRLGPRLFPVHHEAALDYLIDQWITLDGRSGTLLEFGCGRTFHYAQRLGPRFAQCHGTDIEDIASSECPPGVAFTRCSAERIPFPDASFDVVVSRSVMEHLTEPEVTFRELNRVMKPGARLYMNLPNKWDYVSVVARLFGSRKRRLLQQVAGLGYEDFDVYYRCNTARGLEHAVSGTDLRIQRFRPLPSAPVYLSFFAPAYVVGAIYQFAISLLVLDFLQPSFVVTLSKR